MSPQITAGITARLFLRAHRRNNVQLYPDDWKKLPIPDASPAEQASLITLVDNILAAKKQNPTANVSAWEAEIDTLVYALYGLEPDEIAVIEGGITAGAPAPQAPSLLGPDEEGEDTDEEGSDPEAKTTTLKRIATRVLVK